MMMQKTERNPALHLLQALTGAFFIFSGALKGNDPVGFGYKLQEYFSAAHITFLNPFSAEIAVFICALEILLGLMLLLGMYRRKVSYALLALMVFFTLLTFSAAMFNIVTNCGCFGDAIVLTPWQSFSKDVALLFVIIFITINNRNLYRVPLAVKHPVRSVIILILLALVLPVLTLLFGPVIDFMPYRRGANIPALMQMPAGKTGDKYSIIYHLKNTHTGVVRQMSDKEYLSSKIWQNADWEITGEPEKKLVSKGYRPPVNDLNIVDESGNSYTDELLGNPFYNIIVVAYNINTANKTALQRMNAIAAQAAKEYNMRTVLLTASAPADVNAYLKNNGVLLEPFYADDVALKQMVRSNPGVLLLKNGNIVNKWQHTTFPSYGSLREDYFNRQD